ncbi:MAG: ATP-dependent zinc protease [Methanolobus sp.]|nr:ATP-dependent zinc protease [Methanolobus sp.]
MNEQEDLLTLGWREWLALPDLGLHAIKAKIDTGARTSALHAFNIKHYMSDDIEMVRFLVHPIQKNQDYYIECKAPIKDQRQVTDSGGHKEIRYVIETDVVIASRHYPIELTLTDRDTMRFRMLLGRSAMKNVIMVDPSASFLHGKIDLRTAYNLIPEVDR